MPDLELKEQATVEVDKTELYNFLLIPSSMLFKQTLVVITSAIINCKKPCKFFIMERDWSDELKQELTDYIGRYPGQIVEFININNDEFDSFSKWKGRTEPYYKMVAHNYLPNDIDRVLYLDIDLYVAKDIYDLYYMDFEDNYLIAANEQLSLSDYEKLVSNGVEKHGFINTGVVLFNLDKMREDKITKDTYLDYIKKLNGECFFDQGLLSAVFMDSIKVVPSYKYNHVMFQEGAETIDVSYKKIFLTPLEERKKRFVKVYWDEEYDKEHDSTIVHFPGRFVVKPWQVIVKLDKDKISIQNIPYLEKTRVTHDIADNLYLGWWEIAKKLPRVYFEALMLEAQIFENGVTQKSLTDSLNGTKRVYNFCSDLCFDIYGSQKFDRYLRSLSGKKLAILKKGDAAGRIFIKAAEKIKLNIVFMSTKPGLGQLTPPPNLTNAKKPTSSLPAAYMAA